MTDVTTIVDTYLEMWNEPDQARRADLIRTAWIESGHYVDPLMESRGYDGLSTMVDGVQQQFPGATFRRTSGVDQHHALIRFGWELVAADGTSIVAGLDIGVVSDDGRLDRIAGFLGELPEAEAAAA